MSSVWGNSWGASWGNSWGAASGGGGGDDTQLLQVNMIADVGFMMIRMFAPLLWLGALNAHDIGINLIV